jgi:hypothetical protein
MGIIELWWLSLAIFAVVVVVVAVLLGMIIAAAKSIDGHALQIWTEGKKIAGNTVTIWVLEKVNETCRRMESSVQAVEKTAAAMDEKLGALAERR